MGSNITDEDFLDFIVKHKYLGYGNMMQIISDQWYIENPKTALSVGICYALIEKTKKAKKNV
jgi:hypothetical protein